jgi:Tfp pilus tip-associated adhesin PilY1
MAMKKTLLGFGLFLMVWTIIPAQQTWAVLGTGASGAFNNQFACVPPFITQAAKPNLHYVVDVTGSMDENVYRTTSSFYVSALNYYGLFKNAVYYKYNTTNTRWEENSCTPLQAGIGQRDCVSGNLLNYITMNKIDIIRKILTGGRPLSTDATVLEHEGADGATVSNKSVGNTSDPITSCIYNTSTNNTIKISNAAISTTISAQVKTTDARIKITNGQKTFKREDTGSFLADGWAAGDTFTTTGFTNNATTWTVATGGVTEKILTVTANTAATETKTVTLTGPTKTNSFPCKILTNSIGTMYVTSATKTFTRTDGGSFITDGWAAGMSFISSGFSNAGNNNTWTIAATGGVTATTITVTSSTGMVNIGSGAAQNANFRTTATLSAKALVKYDTTTTPMPTGLIQDFYPEKTDMEISFFSGSSVDYSGGTNTYNTAKNQLRSNYLSAVNTTVPGSTTNTGAALTAAQKFFQQDSTISATLPVSGTALIHKGFGDSDPYYEAPYTYPATTPAATLANSTVASCRKSFVILLSDGQWTAGGTDPVWPAFTMHRRDGTNDLRANTGTGGVSGVQSVTTYAVYAFGGSDIAGRNAMITTAIYGGFDDIDNNTKPYPFTNTASPFRTPTITSGATTSTDTTTLSYPLAQCDPDGTWTASCKEWDKAGTGLPYNFFEADDGDSLSTSLTNAMNDIMAKTSSSTAASILGNNDNAGASLVQAIFYPEKQFDGTIKASWIGEVQAFWYYLDPKLNNVTIRADTVQDLALKLNEDQVAQFTFDGTYTKVNLYADANGDGAIDTPASPASTVDLEDVNTLWRAGKSLWSRAASDRTIYTNNPTVTTNVGSRLPFTSANAATLQPYLDVSAASGAVPTATDVINYARGTDVSTSYSVRSRQIQLGTTLDTWKLGDVINSTPKIASEVRLNSFNLVAPAGYSDSSYDRYIKSKDYQSRGTAYLGANDGMLHAFKTGSNYLGGTQGTVSQIKDSDGTAYSASHPSDLGKEKWAFVPKNVLPYLQYLMNPVYRHMYFVDGTPLVVDASIGVTTPISCSDATYYSCKRTTTFRTATGHTSELDYSTAGDSTSWRTVLLGSMGLGGASRYKSGTCANSATMYPAATYPNGLCVKSPLDSVGLSSFFALDITEPISETATDYPKLLWEFSDPRLGYSTTSPTVMRIRHTDDTAASPRNGRWVAVLASGPTGPISQTSMAFNGYTDMPLTIFVVDLKTGALLRTFNNLPSSDALNTANSAVHTQVAAMPSYAFAGSLTSSVADVDKYDSYLDTRLTNPTQPQVAYSDDVLYIGYTKGDLATPMSWNMGGVLRMLTYNDPNPANWKVSKVIDNIGPVTTGVTKLQDKYNEDFWLFFGTGRYFTKADDPTNVQTMFGVKDPCYYKSTNTSVTSAKHTFINNCTTTINASTTATGVTSASASTLVNQTSSINTTTVMGQSVLASGKEGWYINLSAASGTNYPKRVVTNPVANPLGLVYFTTFTPSTDVCTYGGTTSLWCAQYNTGGNCGTPDTTGAVASGTAASTVTRQKGQILIQLSTGAFQQVDVSKAFSESNSRETTAYQGVPPKSEPAATTNAGTPPSKRILHIKEW